MEMPMMCVDDHDTITHCVISLVMRVCTLVLFIINSSKDSQLWLTPSVLIRN